MKPFGLQRVVIDARGVLQCAMADRIVDDLVDFAVAVAEAAERRRTVRLMILK